MGISKARLRQIKSLSEHKRGRSEFRRPLSKSLRNQFNNSFSLPNWAESWCKTDWFHLSSRISEFREFLLFLNGQFTRAKCHGFLRSGNNKRIGLVGEQNFAKLTENFIYHPYDIWKSLPLLPSTPDFITTRPHLLLTEIKTCTSLKNAKNSTLTLQKSIFCRFRFAWRSSELKGLISVCSFSRKTQE